MACVSKFMNKYIHRKCFQKVIETNTTISNLGRQEATLFITFNRRFTKQKRFEIFWIKNLFNFRGIAIF